MAGKKPQKKLKKGKKLRKVSTTRRFLNPQPLPP
jgi:hypothetical protein